MTTMAARFRGPGHHLHARVLDVDVRHSLIVTGERRQSWLALRATPRVPMMRRARTCRTAWGAPVAAEEKIQWVASKIRWRW